jgi:hypothetical protein
LACIAIFINDTYAILLLVGFLNTTYAVEGFGEASLPKISFRPVRAGGAAALTGRKAQDLVGS